MIIWKDILKPISTFVSNLNTVEEVIFQFTDQNTDIVFVTDKDTLVGYCTYELILKQIAKSGDLSERVQYNEEILKVPVASVVEYFHNVSMIVGMNSDGEIIGYTTMEQAKYFMNELKLKDLNFLLQSAGVGIIRMNPEFQIEFMNETAKNILGLPGSFLLLRNYKNLFTIDKDLEVVLQGETLVNVNSSINFKQITGNFYPLKTEVGITGLIYIFFLRETLENLSREIMQETSIPSNQEKQSNLNFEDIQVNEKQLVYRSKKIESLVAAIKRVAVYNSTILLEGESGVGKEMFAQLIHSASERKTYQLVRMNCGAIPENLIESELFGYEKGAFTEAEQDGKAGLFEIADRGTLFLDEIARLPINMQAKLLQVLREKEVTRIGGTRPIPVDVRIIAATNKDIKKMVDQGEFREDLYCQLNVIPFQIPSLRERKEDVFPLSIYFLEQFNQLYDFKKFFTPEAIEVLETYEWPGNVRELQNMIERMVLLSGDEWIQREMALKFLYGETQKDQKQHIQVLEIIPMKEAVEELEIQLIERGLKQYRTASKLSQVLGVSPATISRRMKKLKT